MLSTGARPGDFHFSRKLIDVLGREDEQAQLRAFADDTPGFQWAQLAGAGGQGKSRLAFDLAEEIKEKRGWQAGFLLPDDLSDFSDAWADWRPQKPTLMIVDYVLTSLAELEQAVKTLTRRSAEFGVPVRLLLVERQRWDRAGLVKQPTRWRGGASAPEIGFTLSEGHAYWFSQLCRNRHSGIETAMHGSMFRHEDITNGIIELEHLTPPQLVDIVRRVAAKERPGFVVPLKDGEIEAHLERIDKSGRPLYAYFLAKALASGAFRPGWGRDDLLLEVLLRDREDRFDQVFGPDHGLKIGAGDLATRLSVLATMAGGVDAVDLIGREGWEGVDDPDRAREAIALNDGPLGPIDEADNLVPALLPDILGEFAVIYAFSKYTRPHLEHLAQEAWALKPEKMAEFLLHCAQDFPERDETFELLGVDPDETSGWDAYAIVSATIFRGLGFDESCKYPENLFTALKRAIKLEHPHALTVAGYLHLLGIHFEKCERTAFKFWFDAAILEDVVGMRNVGNSYANGLGVETNFSIAIEWWRKAAQAGDAVSKTMLGYAYDQGKGVEVDHAKAVELWREAVEAGYAAAMTALGYAYDQGEGVEVDHAKAVELWREAAEAGDVVAMTTMGYVYDQGKGVDIDHAKAVELWREAAEAGYSEAQTIVAHYPDQIGLSEHDSYLIRTADDLVDAAWPLVPLIDGDWRQLTGEVARPALASLSRFSRLAPDGELQPIALRETELDFYPGWRLVEALVWSNSEERIVCLIQGHKQAALLTGGSHVIHSINKYCPLRIDTRERACAYFKFFFNAVDGGKDSFYLLDTLRNTSFTYKYKSKKWNALSSKIYPLTFFKETKKAMIFNGTLQHSQTLFHATFRIATCGEIGKIDLLDCEEFASGLPLYRDGFDGVFRVRRPHPGGGAE